MKHYFRNREVTSAVQEYQATGNQAVLGPYTKDIRDLILAVINANRFRQFGIELEDLQQEAFVTSIQCLKGFDPNYGKSLFSYLSLAVKYRLIDITKRDTRHRQRNILVTGGTPIFSLAEEQSRPAVSVKKSLRFKVKKNGNPMVNRTIIAIDALMVDDPCCVDGCDAITHIMKMSGLSRLQTEKAVSTIQSNL